MDRRTQNRQPGHKGAQEMNKQQKTRILSGFLNGMVEVRGIEPRSDKEVTEGATCFSPSLFNPVPHGAPAYQGESDLLGFCAVRTELHRTPHVK